MCGVPDFGLLELLFDLIMDLFFIFWVKERREFTNIQDIIDVFYKGLLLDVFVREGEDNLLVVDTQSLVKVSEIVKPLWSAIVLV